MVGLLLIITLLGLWLIASALADADGALGLVDLSTAELVLGEGAGRWIAGLFGAAMLLIGVLGLVTSA
jgi:hypothetical protein